MLAFTALYKVDPLRARQQMVEALLASGGVARRAALALGISYPSWAVLVGQDAELQRMLEKARLDLAKRGKPQRGTNLGRPRRKGR